MKNEYKTKTRQLILDFLNEHTESCFTAADIYKNINESDGSINRATVYRNLDRLCQQGILLKFKDNDSDASLFRYSGDHEHCDSHMHAQCSDCGKLFHIEGEFARKFEEEVKTAYGIDVDPKKTIIVGKCDDCKNN
ncbi:MAG: transcriptional repressor [Lachnospiraceae bacterium]|jgi:Fur family ferric uptake transcriptional regulator|nr:transcriptional repressor [Lachnospiraceae bacterium]